METIAGGKTPGLCLVEALPAEVVALGISICDTTRDGSRIVGISGQSLPILAPLPTIDVLWSDLHMVHKDRSLMSYESFYWTFRTA